MDNQMQEKCDKKLRELQQNIPFLLTVLERLRNNNLNDPSRQTQFEKIQKLYNLLNDTTQTLKWELLVKCENVVTKLQIKMQGENELVASTNSPSPVQKIIETNKETEDRSKETDLACPESPPPQQEEEYFDNRQPVVIPTERRCSPLPISSRNRENYESDRSHHDERKEKKHKSSHRRHDHSHRDRERDRDRDRERTRDHHSHRDRDHQSHHDRSPRRRHSKEKRSSYHESRSVDTSRDRSSSEKTNYSFSKSSIYNERGRDKIVDQYLSLQKNRVDWSRSESYDFPFESSNAYENQTASPTRRRSTVFKRLGEKIVLSSDDDDIYNQSFNRNQNAMHSSTLKLSNTPAVKQTLFNVTKTSPSVPDFLKSAPLSASDITQLLTEGNTNSNSNSNPNEILGISDIGTRRNTLSTSISNKTATVSSNDSNSNLDFVRKKFALLTKSEGNSNVTATPPSISNSHSISFQITPPSSDPVASKYYSHSRVNSDERLTSSSVMPNSNVNVLPTLRPNDPRLRKARNMVNGNTSNNLFNNNNHIPNLNLRQGPTATSLQFQTSPISNYSIGAQSTPSPIYGTTSNLGISSATKVTNQTKIKDPRLQHKKNNFNTTQKRPLLVPVDSSDENWDVDDNASDVVFPQPRPFPNQNAKYSVEQTKYNSADTHATSMHHLLPAAMPQRRQSFVWDNMVTSTNNNILQSKLPHQDEINPFSHSNWHGMPATSPSSSNERFDAFHSNTSNERSTYKMPRTYGAYKEARARAAAEQAAKRAAEIGAKLQKKTADADQSIESADASKLNTIYRNSNITKQHLPKSMESFKIPKKGVVATTDAEDSDEKSKPKEGDEKKEKTKSYENEMKQQEDEKKVEKSKENIDVPEAEIKESESPKNMENKDTLNPKPQRERFKDKQKLSAKSNLNKDLAVDLQSETILTNDEPTGRITKRRATMIDKASAPEVDKEKLLQTNAMLFEDLQDRERKKQTELTENKVHVTNRKIKEICFEKTDDGCTVSTQNIISGKRRTRTTANFNEVKQGIAVFKHLKSNQVTPAKDRKKRGPKPKIKPVINTEEENEKAEDIAEPVKENESKIRKRRMILVNSETKVKIKKEPIEEAVKIEKPIDGLPNVNSIFDTFIQKIIHPSANSDELIDKLRDILSEQEIESLISIREAMIKKNLSENPPKDVDISNKKDECKSKVSNNIKCEKAVGVVSEKVKELEDTENEKIKETEQSEAAPLRPNRQRRNELDRLHDDIRDMFISEGVLTATGKRMCTFVEPCSLKFTDSDKGNADIQPKANSTTTKITAAMGTTTTTQPQNLPNMRKSRVLLPTLKMKRRSIRKQQLKSNQDSGEESDENLNANENSCSNASFSSDTTQVSSTNGINFSTISSVNTDSMTEASCSFTKSDSEPLLRRMPVLKPVKSIRLREEDELDEWLAKQKGPIATGPTQPKLVKTEITKKDKKRYKPCPKSKKPAGAFYDDEENDNSEHDDDHDDVDDEKEKNDHPNVVEDKTKDVDIIACEEHKIKSEIFDISVPFKIEYSKDNEDTESAPKNINPKWHWMSRYAQDCVICKKRFMHMSPHYKKHHSENYVSRLAPSVLHELKKEDTNLNKPFLKLHNKKTSLTILLSRCPFCFQFKYTSIVGWLEHFITHTGEYFYECRLCHKTYNKPAMIERHMKDKCEALGGRYLHNDEFKRSFKGNVIKAHVCHLCNYLRLGRVSLERHYMEQHGYDVKSLNDSIGFTIDLISFEDVPRANTFEEIVEMEKKLNQQSQLDIICLSDSDDVADEVSGMKVDETTEQEQSIKNNKVKKATELKSVDKSKVTGEENKNSALKEKSTIKEKVIEMPTIEITNKKNTESKGTEIGTRNEDGNNSIQINKAPEVPKTTTQLAAPLSSVFLSTTDDSNDDEAPTIFARKLLTVDSDTDICTNRSPKPRLSGNISMAERLSQRLKEAEANTANNLAKQCSKKAETITLINPPKQSEENAEEEKKHSKSETISENSDKIIANQTESDTQANAEETTDSTSAVTKVLQETLEEKSEDTAATSIYKSDEGEIDLTQEGDDDEWEDIEIVETAPSAVTTSSSTKNQSNKDVKLQVQKNKKNRLHNLSRFYATIAPSSKFNKKSANFKPLINIFNCNVNKTEKLEDKVKDNDKEVIIPDIVPDKVICTNEVNEVPASTTNSESIETVASTSTMLDFRPIIPNLEDLLPDSPCNDPIEIVPELAPSSPLKELNDITSLLGTNLIGLMDIDVEEPPNSVCIHNADNQQTSIQEALDFVSSQGAEYNVAANSNQPLEENTLTTDSLNFGSMNRIQNVGYTCADTNNDTSIPTTFRFYCFSNRCTFLYSSEAIGLENHFLLEHPNSKWNGYCNTCALQVKVNIPTNDLTFSDEFKHLLDMHILKSNLNLQSKDNKDVPTAESQKKRNAPLTTEQPRLKLRRLSGDCLSSSASLQADSASPTSTLMESMINDSNSFSDLIQFNHGATTPIGENLLERIIPTSLESLPDDVPYFTNISKDFQITSISSGLEPTEISAIVKNAFIVEAANQNVDKPNAPSLQISNVISLANHKSPTDDSTENNVTTTSTTAIKSTTTTNAAGTSFPKITNVCSLNSSLASQKVASIWTKQKHEERTELDHSYNDSIELAAILSNNRQSNSKPNDCQQRSIDNGSPGPMIVSEILPTGQSMSGNFVITQTVSAQYAEATTEYGVNKPKLGFNISISSAALGNALKTNSKTSTITTTTATKPTTVTTTTIPTTNTTTIPTKNTTTIKTTFIDTAENNSTTIKSFVCLDPGCKFTTRHLVAMIDHIKSHEQRNLSLEREYLRCCICKEKLLNTDAYTNHIRSEHFSVVKSPALPVIEPKMKLKRPKAQKPIASCALTQKIRNILCQKAMDVPNKELSVIKNLLIDPTKSAVNDENTAFKMQLIETVKEIVAKTGICDSDLYRCLVKDCNVKLKESSYHVHVLYHLSTLGGANNTFPCPHCKGKCQNISALKTHIKSHRRHHIFCYVCLETASNDSNMSRHFAQKHWYKKELSKHLLVQEQTQNGSLIAYYVTNFTSLNDTNVRDFGKKLIVEWQRKQAASRTHFNPDEVDLLPIQAIFSKEIYCSMCLYKTKVRTNMVRHMAQHKNMATSADTTMGGNPNAMPHNERDGNGNEQTVNTMVVCMDPINPVPCLISNEKHFDRMTNLASSSLGPIANANNAGIGNNNAIASLGVCRLRYTYIPESKRFQCGVPGCNYITIFEDVFRSHLHVVHKEERSYQCIFCNEELCKRSLAAERIVQHLRFHDRTLYQCEICDHNHYIRHIVDRHALEKHGSVQRTNILMFVREEEGCLEGTKKVIITYGKKKDSKTNSGASDGNHSTVGGVKVENNPSNDLNLSKDVRKSLKYICDICEHKTITHNQIIAHANAKHGIKKAYQCGHCQSFTEWSETNVQAHINEDHPGEIMKVNRIFGKMNAAQLSKVDNNLDEPLKPLWQRDDPTRQRQIRGIPMEDEEETEKLRKRLRLSEDFYDEEDGDCSNESSSLKSRGRPPPPSNFFLNQYEFGCFHCEYKARNIDELKSKHWGSTHNSGDGLTSKPFLFRLLIRLKCSECQDFTGCFWELQKHMTEDHSKPTSHALDPRMKKIVCGYCEYDCNNKEELLWHHLSEDHQPQDIKGLFSVQMAKVLRLECLTPVMYVHCTLCSELFNSRLAVVQHAAEKHTEDTEHFSFRELSNTTIYRCCDCFYTSTDEMTTLRHMINHYHQFKRCNFCNLTQSSFNEYMQHCYSEHRTEIKRFSEIYPLNEIRKYLLQILIIFPNGWIINKKNLCNTPYGNEERIKLIYTEICKTSQEPPIPRLSIGRLVARMSSEANKEPNSKDDIQISRSISSVSSKKQISTQKIAKRRSTFAVTGDDELNQQNDNKKPKLSGQIEQKPNIHQEISKSESECINPELIPYSYYGRRPDKEDWSKLHTKISIAGVSTPISLDKFILLFKIDTQVVLQKINIDDYKLPRPSCSPKNEENSSRIQNHLQKVQKACPASQKYRFV